LVRGDPGHKWYAIPHKRGVFDQANSDNTGGNGGLSVPCRSTAQTRFRRLTGTVVLLQAGGGRNRGFRMLFGRRRRPDGRIYSISPVPGAKTEIQLVLGGGTVLSTPASLQLTTTTRAYGHPAVTGVTLSRRDRGGPNACTNPPASSLRTQPSPGYLRHKAKIPMSAICSRARFAAACILAPHCPAAGSDAGTPPCMPPMDWSGGGRPHLMRRLTVIEPDQTWLWVTDPIFLRPNSQVSRSTFDAGPISEATEPWNPTKPYFHQVTPEGMHGESSSEDTRKSAGKTRCD